MVATCSVFAQNLFDFIINRDYGSISDNYDPNDSLWYIITDYKIFTEIYKYCINKCSKHSIDLYFGKIDYERIKFFLDKWSIESIEKIESIKR